MFFSLGFDVKEHYKDFGGDAAAHAAPTNDLQGVRAINTIDLDGLHTLGTVVVDYRGMRVTAQTIVPGMCVRLLFFFFRILFFEKKNKLLGFFQACFSAERIKRNYWVRIVS